MEIRRKVNPSFWHGKRVFVTGHTGFKGSWLTLWLHSMGAIVKGYALEPPTNPSLFEVANVNDSIFSEIGDIRNLEALKKSMKEFSPDVLIHMAAQPLVRLSYIEPIETYTTNVIGTVNVLESARYCINLKAILSITTDKCYENREWVWGYREHDPMGGHDPYSSSKGCAELVTSAYRSSFFKGADTAHIASARAGNVIGGGDWAQDRLVPDILNAIDHNETIIVRNPKAIRPWQHVLEPLSGYLLLLEDLYNNGEPFASAWNFGPKDDDCKSVEWILNRIKNEWNGVVTWKVEQDQQLHEAQLLKLDCSKAASLLNWYPFWDAKEAVKKIVEWHLSWKSGADMNAYCLNEIEQYNK